MALRPVIDVDIKDDEGSDELEVEKHVKFLLGAASGDEDDYEYVMTEYLRLSGIYWTLTALDLIGALDKVRLGTSDGLGEKIVEFVVSCQHSDGGFSCSTKHDSHILYTLSAVQILTLYDRLQLVDVESIVHYIQSRYLPDGSFQGDAWGDVDSRFSFCAIATLSLLGRLDAVDCRAAGLYVRKCMNFDGGFGTQPGSESHSGQVYCCLGTLSILHQLDYVDCDQLGFWLAQRQLPSGGLNGRPEKLPDVCYSWWVMSGMQIIGRLDYIRKDKLSRYIKACQDVDSGGIADRPGDMADPFHTLFGLAGLSLLNTHPDKIKAINPVFCMPQYVIDRLKINLQTLR